MNLIVTFLGANSVVSFALLAVCCFAPMRTVFYLLAVTAPMTTVAALNVGNNSVLIYHLVWLAFAVRVLLHKAGGAVAMRPFLLPFLLYALASIPLAFLNTDVVVVNVDSVWASLQPSVQQATQWAYLLMAVSTLWFTDYLVRAGVVGDSDVMRALDIGLVVVLSVAFLQLVVPTEVMNQYLRNSVHTGYNFVGASNRLSSLFQEPSMLSLYLMPMVAMHAVRMLESPGPFSAAVIVLSLAVSYLNNSSSAFLGLALAAVVLAVIALSRARSSRVGHVTVLVVLAAAGAVVLVVASGIFDSAYGTLLSKLAGEGVSGRVRTSNFDLTMGVFLGHPVLGVGWGTVRCESLAATWLAEMGVVGALLFAVPVLRLLRSLWRGRGAYGLQLASYLLVYLGILLVSCGEPYYLTPWVVLGFALAKAPVREGAGVRFAHLLRKPRPTGTLENWADHA